MLLLSLCDLPPILIFVDLDITDQHILAPTNLYIYLQADLEHAFKLPQATFSWMIKFLQIMHNLEVRQNT